MTKLAEILQKRITLWLGIISLLSALGGGLAWAKPLLLAEYALNEDVQAVQKQVDKRFVEFQILKYQDSIDEIKDKEIDGTASNSDLKKKHRYETKIKNLREQIR